LPKPTLFIHIGMPKTGTTSLQGALNSNRQLLINQGILYAKADFTGAHHDIAQWVRLEKDKDFLLQFFKEAVEEYKKNNCTRIVISSEYFFYSIKNPGIIEKQDCYKKIRKNLQMLKEVIPDDFTVKIIAYLRRQDLALDARYNQQVKYSNSFDLTPMEVKEKIIAQHYFDYELLLKVWADLFGKENVIVRAYEKQQLPEGTVVDFLSNILQVADTNVIKQINSTTILENPRLNRDLLEYKFVLNKIYKDDPLFRNQLYSDFLQVNLQMERDEEYPNVYTLAERESILEYYAESNRNVAREYLGREDGRLFLDRLPEKGKENSYPGLSLEKAIEISWRLHKLEMDRIESKVNDLYVLKTRLQKLFGFRLINKFYAVFRDMKRTAILHRIQKSGLFDWEYYENAYPIVKKTGMDPLQHYLNYGWQEGFNPSRNFNSAEYLKDHPELYGTGQNPLVHYLKHGKNRKYLIY